jgi:hypothetical protein
MKRVFGLALLGLVLAMPAPARADGITPGNWQVTTVSFNGTTEQILWLVKLDTKNDKVTATLEAGSPLLKEPSLVSFDAKGTNVRVVFKWMAGKTAVDVVFQGTLSKDGKKIVGAYEQRGIVSAAYMVPTELTKLDAETANHKLGIEEMNKATTLANKAQGLRLKAGQTKDADEKKRLLNEAAEAEKVAGVEVPKLYREVMDKYPGTVAAGRAAVLLLQQTKEKATAPELASWAEVANKAAAKFGPHWEIEIDSQIALALSSRPGAAALAVTYAKKTEALLDAKAPLDTQIKILQVLVRALSQADMPADLKLVNARLERLEAPLDKEYLAKVPPFKAEPFAGRRGKSDRVVVMELFTGAECPPCVAADVAFDVLSKSYRPQELVLIQYHMHIPGPDPMNTPACEARWKYYRDAWGPKEVGGTPTTLFNGFREGGSGGFMANAEAKYQTYCEIINPMLDKEATCKVTAQAKRSGDKIHITAGVTGMNSHGKDVKLRLVLVEEHIRYLGGNKLRLHHQVVRDMPGGADGVAVTKATMTMNSEVDLKQLKKELNDFLDDYAAAKRAFPRVARPMDMHGLRLIAFVQDDTTHEILQAVQVNVTE